MECLMFPKYFFKAPVLSINECSEVDSKSFERTIYSFLRKGNQPNKTEK